MDDEEDGVSSTCYLLTSIRLIFIHDGILRIDLDC